MMANDDPRDGFFYLTQCDGNCHCQIRQKYRVLCSPGSSTLSIPKKLTNLALLS